METANELGVRGLLPCDVPGNRTHEPRASGDIVIEAKVASARVHTAPDRISESTTTSKLRIILMVVVFHLQGSWAL
jgi:hypothetical protein